MNLFAAWIAGALTMGVSVPAVTHQGSLTEGLRSPARIAVSGDDSVLVTDPFNNRIARFDESGSALGVWAVAEGPIGVAAHPDGRYFVSLRDEPRVAIYDASFSRIGYLGEGEVTFVKPTDIDIAMDTGRIYVVDAGGDRVYGFEPSGALAVSFGARGERSGELKYPSSIAVDEARGRLVVADHDNFRIQAFTTSGIFMAHFGYWIKYLPGGAQEGWMPRTAGVAVDSDGNIYVADALMSTVRVFSAAGTEIDKVVEYGSDPGDIRTPGDLALSNDGSRLYVVSTNSSSVEIYSAFLPTPALASVGLGQAQGDFGGREPGTNVCAYDALRRDEITDSSVVDSSRTRSSKRGLAGRAQRSESGSLAAADPADYEGPHMVDGSRVCGRCHGITGQPGEHVGLVEGQSLLCMSCHTAAGQALNEPLHEKDVADPYGTNPNVADGRGRSHAWGVSAVNPLADSDGPPLGSEMELYLDAGQIKCSTCHDQHTNGAGSPYLRVSNAGDALCKGCHAPRDKGPGEGGTHPVGFAFPSGVGEFPPAEDVFPLVIKAGKVECMTCHAPHFADSGGANNGEGDGMLLRGPNDETHCQTCHSQHTVHTPGGDWQPTCLDCHDAHDPDNENLSLVAATVQNQTLLQDKSVVFTAGEGSNSFDDGDPAQNDGICQVCHTATSYHTHDGSGAPHNDGVDCMSCHPHDAGFMPSGGDCTSCHSSPQDNGDGLPVGGRRAVVGEFPESDAHAHYGAELGSAACTVCHDQATHMDGYVDLIDPDGGPNYRFIRPADLDTDPDTSTFCAGCHDMDGATALAAPLDPFGNGNAPPEVASRFLGTLQWYEEYGDFCFGTEGTQRAVNSHHDISDQDQAFSGAKLECLSCHGAHTSAASQPVVDPLDTTAAWTGDGSGFCLACHAGGNGPNDPGFPAGVVGPIIALRGIESCDYVDPMWYVDYTWTHSAHGPDSKRGWNGYSGAPAYDLDCKVCHDPHGSYTATNTVGNPYMIRDVVDGTPYIDDATRTGGVNGPPWNTYGTLRDVTVSISGIEVDWGSGDSLCSACHADWLNAYDWHSYCTSCQTCHAHGMAFGEHDFVGADDNTPCPLPPAPAPAVGEHGSSEMEVPAPGAKLSDDPDNPVLHLWGLKGR